MSLIETPGYGAQIRVCIPAGDSEPALTACPRHSIFTVQRKYPAERIYVCNYKTRETRMVGHERSIQGLYKRRND